LISCSPIIAKSVPRLFTQALQGLVKEEEEKNNIYDSPHDQGSDSSSDTDSDSDSENTIATDDELTGDYDADDRDTRPVRTRTFFFLPQLIACRLLVPRSKD
jgi:hypothetical protein